MPEPVAPLDYADPTRGQRVRRRRRFWLVALVLSAIAVGVVGRLLFLRLRVTVAAQLEAVNAQREVDALPPVGNGFTLERSGSDRSGRVTITHPGVPDIDIVATVARFLRPHGATPNSGGAPLAAYRLLDAAGRERVVCLILSAGGFTWPVDSAQIIVWEREPATLLGGAPAAPAAHVLPLAVFRDRFHLDRPMLDATDRRRLRLTGDADRNPFAYELTLDANDRPSLLAIPATTTQTTR